MYKILYQIEQLEQIGIFPTTQDEKAVLEHINKGIALEINDEGKIFNEGGIYIADIILH